jgi:hypothetical protein
MLLEPAGKGIALSLMVNIPFLTVGFTVSCIETTEVIPTVGGLTQKKLDLTDTDSGKRQENLLCELISRIRIRS